MKNNLSDFLKGIASNYGGGSADMHFVRPGFFSADKVLDNKGEEIGLGYSTPTDLHSRSYQIREGKIGGSSRFSRGGDLGGHYSDVLSKSRGTGGSRVSNLVFAYDPQITERLGYLAANTPGSEDIFGTYARSQGITSRAAIVDVKQLVSNVFPSMQAASSKIESVATALGISYATTAGGYMDPGDTPGVLRQIVKKAHAHDPARVKNAILGAGFGGTSIVDPADPHNIASYMGQINKIKGISDKAATQAIHIQGRENLGKFTKKLGTVFGRDYGDRVGSFAESIFANVRDENDVAFLLTNDRRVFIGMSGAPNRYYEIPGQMGGVVSKGGKLAGAKPIGMVGGIRSATKQFLDTFKQGMGQPGKGFSNIGAALEKGSISANRGKVHGRSWGSFGGRQGSNFADKTILNPATALGRTSLHSAIFDQATIYGSERPFFSQFENTLLHGGILKAGKVGPGMDISGLPGAMGRALHADYNKLGGMKHLTGLDPSASMYVKAKQSKGIYPTSKLHGYGWGGYSERDYAKGRYHIRGRAEVTSGSSIRRIARSRANLGIGGASPMAVAPQAMRTERLLSAAHTRISRSWGGGSRQALVELNSVMGVVSTVGSIDELMLGDSGALRTQSGGQLLARRHSLRKTSASFGKAEVGTMLTELLGTSESAQEIIKNVQAGQSYSFTDPRAFSGRRGARVNALWKGTVPDGARALGAVGWNQYNQAFEFSFMTKEMPGEWSSVFVNNARVTAQSMSERHSKSMFGGLGSITDLIVNERTAASMGMGNIHLNHMLGLVGTAIGREQGGAEAFLKGYGGKGLTLTGSGRITRGAGFSLQEFLTLAPSALQKMGFTKAQTYGLVTSGTKFKAGMDQVLPGSGSGLGAAGKLVSMARLSEEDLMGGKKGIYAFIGSVANKASADLDLGDKSAGAFAMKVQSLHLMSQSVEDLYGLSSIEDHPVFARVFSHFEKSTGMKLNYHRSSPQGFVKGFSDEMRHMTAALRGPMKGRRIMSRKAAAAAFVYTQGGLRASHLNANSPMSIEDLMGSKLMQAGREGFYLDMGKGQNFQLPTKMPTPDQFSKGKSMQVASRYLYIPGGSTLQRMIGPGRPGVDSYLGNMLSLLQQPGSMSGQKGGQSAITVNQAFYRTWSHISSGTASKNFMRNTMFSSGGMGGSVTGRILNKDMSMGNILKGARDRYTVTVGEHTIQDMARSLSADLKKPYNEVHKEMLSSAKAGKLYGSITPRPQHSASHMQVVRIALGGKVKGTEAIPGKHYVKMHAFHAFTQNRDLDMDNIDLMALHSSQYKNMGQMERLIASQEKNSNRQYLAWQRNKNRAVDSQKLIEKIEWDKPGGLKRLSELSLSYFGFGQTPALSWMGNYSNLAVAGELADETLTAEAAAKRLNRFAGDAIVNPFQPEDIQRLRSLYQEYADTTLKGSFARAIELQRNVLQGSITKGGPALETVIKDYLNIPYEISDMLTRNNEAEAVALATAKSKTFLKNLAGVTPEMLEDEKVMRIFSEIQTGFGYHGSAEDSLNRMAKSMGALQAVTAIAQFQSGPDGKPRIRDKASFPNIMRAAVGKKFGDVKSLWGWVQGNAASELQSEELDSLALGVHESTYNDLGNQARKNTAEAGENAAKKAAGHANSQNTLHKMATKLRANWKMAAGITAGLLALRAISGMGSPAPIPKDPMISLPEDGAIAPMMSNTAYMQPTQGFSSNVNIAASYSSESMGSDLLNRRNSFNNVQIADSRKFRSNFEMHQMQKNRDRGDFTHQYQS